MKKSIDIKWDLLGAELALMGDIEQSEFFSGFAKELASSSYDSHYQRECQMFSVNHRMGSLEKKTLSEYFPALWYKQGDL